jgi:hypothetical protein
MYLDDFLDSVPEVIKMRLRKSWYLVPLKSYLNCIVGIHFTIECQLNCLERETMSDHSAESSYTEEEIQANSRADALAIFSVVVIAVGLLVFYVAS